MVISINATADVENARVAITAQGGTVGDSFHVLRRDRGGSNLVRETSEAGIIWQPDPLATRTNHSTNPRWLSKAALTEVRRNLVPNPRCVPGTFETVTRRNLANNPSFEVNGTTNIGFEPSGGAGNITRRTDGGPLSESYIRATWTTGSTSAWGGIYCNSFTATHGDVYIVSAYVRTSIAQKISIGIDWRDASNNIFYSPRSLGFSIPAYDANLSNPTGRNWTRLYFACPAPRNGVNGFPTFFTSPSSEGGVSWPTGSWLDLDSVMVEKIDFARPDSRVNHFRNPSMEYAFQGMNGLNATVARDNTWASSGSWSAKITPNGANSDSVCGPDYDAGDFRFGMVPGKTYTFSADIRLTGPQTGTLHANARSICILYYANGVYTHVYSGQAPNAAGVTRLAVTATIPSNATQAFIRVYNGSNSTTSPIWFDNCLLEEGYNARPYFDSTFASTQFYKYNQAGQDPAWTPSVGFALEPYFDGSSGNVFDPSYDQIASWEGTAGLSTSVVKVKSVNEYASSGAAHHSSRNATAFSIVPYSTVTNDSYTSIQGDNGAMRIGLQANKTYTIKAKIWLPTAQTGTIHARARKIVALYKGPDSLVYAAESTAAPNVPGEYDMSLTFSIPPGATEAYIRLYNGTTWGNGIVAWSQVYVSEHNGSFFDGSTTDTTEFDYLWLGTANASASVQRSQIPTGAASGGATQSYLSSSLDRPDVPNESFARWTLTGPGNAVGIYLNDFTTVPAGNRTAFMRVRSSATISVQPRWRTTGGVATVVGSPVTLQADTWTTIQIQVTNAPADTQIGLLISGSTYTAGQTIDVGRHFHIPDETYSGGYFDGSTDDPDYSGWNGTAHASTSYKTFSALPVTVYDYEARQGLETDYIITSEEAALGESVRLTIPAWGTWLKDPFRPYMNAKVLWNSDSDYTRASDRVLLRARGSKFAVAQWDQRRAPSGTVRIATETDDQSAKVIALLDEAGVIMIDVDINFGVPVRYVSVGDVTGSRVGASDRDLTWQARYFTFQVDEVAYPIGSPVGQSVTYESIDAEFGSYLAIPVNVETYDELAAGTWRE